MVLQGFCSLGAAAMVAVVWARSRQLLARAATLIAGTMLAVPVMLFYDLLAVAVVMAWMVVDARRGGWLPWDKTALVVLVFLTLLGRETALAFSLPYGPVAAVLLLALAWRRCRNAHQEALVPISSMARKSA